MTLGPDLAPLPGDGDSGCSGGCTRVNTLLPGKPLSSPISGIITRWSFLAAYDNDDAQLRVVRPKGAGTYSGIVQSPPAAGKAGTAVSSPVRIPIAAGDFLGIDLEGSNIATRSIVGAQYISFNGAFLGATPTAPVSPATDDKVYLYNAIVEPDANGNGLGDETQEPPKVIPPPLPSLRLGKLSIKPKTFDTKARVRYTTVVAGTVSFRIDRRAGRRWKKTTRHSKVKAKAGKHSLLIRRGRLGDGRYRLVIALRSGNRAGKAQTIGFRIRK